MILEVGSHERLKASVHVALAGLGALCLSYNAIAWLYRRERHLARNALCYGGLLMLEARKVRHHWTNAT